MLTWAKHKVKNKSFSNRVDAKIEFRCCMDRLTRDLKLYRIMPQDLIRVSHASHQADSSRQNFSVSFFPRLCCQAKPLGTRRYSRP